MPHLRRKFFTFEGRMRRKSFARASLTFAFLMMLAAWAGVGLLAFVARNAGLEPGDAGFSALLALGGGAMLLATGVCASAMIIKRARDAGLPPLPFMAAILLGPLADQLLLTPLLDERMFWPFDGMTPVGPLVAVAAWAALVFTPSCPIRPLHEADDQEDGLPA